MKTFTKIIGMSDIRRLPRVGKIHLGRRLKSQRGTEYPKESDDFVVDELPEVVAVYGPHPKELDIIIPVEDQGVFFPQCYKLYGSASSLVCIGDGQTAMRDEKKVIKVDTLIEGGEKGNGRVEVVCAGPDNCAYGNEHGCRRVGLFRFLLHKVTMGGVYQIDTGSFNSIVDLNSSLDLIRSQMAAITGQPRIAGIPLVLKRVPTETRYEGKKAVHYCLRLELRYTLDELRRVGERIAAPAPKVLIDAPTIEQEVEEDLIPASRQIEGGAAPAVGGNGGGEGATEAPAGSPQPPAANGKADQETEENIARAIEILGWNNAQVQFRRAQFKDPKKFAEFLSREVDKLASGGEKKQPPEPSPEKAAKKAARGPSKADIEIMRKGISQMLMNLCGDDKEAALGEFVRIARAHGLNVETTKDLTDPEVIAIWQEVKQLHDRGAAPAAAGRKGQGEQEEIPWRD